MVLLRLSLAILVRASSSLRSTPQDLRQRALKLVEQWYTLSKRPSVEVLCIVKSVKIRRDDGEGDWTENLMTAVVVLLLVVCNPDQFSLALLRKA